jgi:hypothetical protein
MNTRRRKLVRLASLGASALAFLAVAAPEASPVDARSTARLESGTYQVITGYSGRTYRSVWHLEVAASRITGTSEWDCCPGWRVDKLLGTITEDGVEITRFCTGQGNTQPCEQLYKGEPIGTRLKGTWSGNGRSGTWTLYFEPLDFKFSVRAGQGTLRKKRPGLTDALLLGAGRLVDLNYAGLSSEVTAVLALQLHYDGRADVRINLRATKETRGGYHREGDAARLGVTRLVVFQSNSPTCPRVGANARLFVVERPSGDTAELEICQNTISWDDAGVTLTPTRG